MSEEDNQWIVVCKPKRKQIKKEKAEEKKENSKAIYSPGKPQYVIENEENDLQSFMQSECMKVNYQMLKQKILQNSAAKRPKNRIHIQCLGLGDFVKYTKPRYQYYFLKELLLPLCSSLNPAQLSVNCYDPIFTPDCINEVSKLGTCKDNNGAEYKEAFLVLFMPHCERFLYERYCQRFNSGNVLVIGNSIKEYLARCQLIGQQSPDCFTSRAKLEEFKIQDFRESLNDTYCYFI